MAAAAAARRHGYGAVFHRAGKTRDLVLTTYIYAVV